MGTETKRGCPLPSRGRELIREAPSWAAFAAATLVTLWPLGLTNRILAGIDAFTYFLPYWAYRMAELRAGHMPLWNPYLFLGVPFLANPQAAVLYPLHWPLIRLTASQALIWSALLHIWLAAGFSYVFARRSLRLSRAGAWLAAVLFALGGFSLARVENINQLNVLAWLPASLWLLDETVGASSWQRRTRWGAALAIVLALQLLAGHTQTFFINQVGLGLYAAWPLLRRAYGKIRRPRDGQAARSGGQWIALSVFVVTLFVALLLSAGQLLPTLELSRLGLRAGGLSFREAVSFSLRPRLLAQTFLPPYGGGLAEAFGSEGYAEYAGWIGVSGLALALVGARSLRQRPRSRTESEGPKGECREAEVNPRAIPTPSARHGALLLLAALGLFLALGAYNPFYYLLWRFVPGFDLFRAPVRWLALYALGMAGLAGVGLDRVTTGGRTAVANVGLTLRRMSMPRPAPRRMKLQRSTLSGAKRSRRVRSGRPVKAASFDGGLSPSAQPAPAPPCGPGDAGSFSGQMPHAAPAAPGRMKTSPTCQASSRVPGTWAGTFSERVAGGLAAALLLIALAAFQQWPATLTWGGWAIAAALTAGLLWAAPRRPGPARGGLVALVLIELWLAGRALPFAQATAPMALSLRNAPAALLAASEAEPMPQSSPPLEGHAGQRAGRDRFLSMSDIRYDPGDLAELRALQADRLPADAIERAVRVAKQTEVLAPNLSLLWRLPAVDGYDGGVLPLDRYVKLQGLFLPPELLWPDGRLREQLRQVPEGRLLDLTGVRFVITDKQGDLWAEDVYYDLQIPARLAPGETLALDLRDSPAFVATQVGLVAQVSEREPTGTHVADLMVEDADGPPVVLSVADGPRLLEGNAPIRLNLPRPLIPTGITVRVPPGAAGALTVRGLSLIDHRTGAHVSVTVSPKGDFRRIHTGDVKVYERRGAPGRAWLVHGVQPAADDPTALELLRDPAFDPRTTAIIAGEVPPQPPGAARPGEGVTALAWEAERIVLRATVTAPAILVLADSFYPGWQATVDGNEVPILQTNLLFRGVALSPGDHQVAFVYRPGSWRVGLAISLGTLALLLGVVAVAGIAWRGRR